ncbi:glycoside hydrolase family 88 protein [Maribellus sp. CM-23]|uniref:glycoside hydrolase family 88/105 protein n=1 Tax=Maribellus sp. CM-23 TaxID=2781026 RepID=UPI001F21D7B1|nr:glycoside hydrolase family 88 protein [Maribellus sp. CM-23]MCE4565878.1 glycoside hydrolase family 88 protein [Maribellus sp. CM-23]
MRHFNTSLFFLIIVFLITACTPSESTHSQKALVKDVMKRVADWQINHFDYAKEGSPGYLHDYGIDAWTNAVFFTGVEEWAKMSDNSSTYYSWLNKIGSECQWKLPENFVDMPVYSLYHADEFCIGQMFLEMSQKNNNENMRIPTQQRLDWVMSNFHEELQGKKWWSWCDALFMAPPVYARMASLTGDEKYLAFMDTEFKRTYDALHDKEERLFFRDKSYFEKREQNGEKIFWGRGNGWVAGGTVKILRTLPADSPYRSFYEDLLREHVSRLVELADTSGAWHASLLDPESYPAPEASATALITYALAYGINEGFFDKDIYLPRLLESWSALTAMVGDDGKLGWVQPIGADPKSVTEDMTAVYGAGAFLLAGSEVYKLVD